MYASLFCDCVSIISDIVYLQYATLLPLSTGYATLLLLSMGYAGLFRQYSGLFCQHAGHLCQYGVATVSRIDKIIVLFCKRAL